ncbi:hypothetical protein [Mangrovicoccus sp. HB161399]|uniref:hypothetical protein n=1 Tax=Mangrovicoccus sp. HB161399 TaxID=2720392 RepID=UPI0015519B5C|nr:hypothetical protein [Mangrovicoccus sp. HB161399]
MMDGGAIVHLWPLKKGETLSSHDWFPFYGHRFLGSEFMAAALMDGRREDIGTAVILWTEAMRQDPAGTLPASDVQLASLARFPSVEAWRKVRAHVLHGWSEVLVEDVVSGGTVTRLGHLSLVQDIVEDMYRRKRGRDAARSAASLAVTKTRIRKKLAAIGVAEHIAQDSRVIDDLAEHFRRHSLYVTEDNVRDALSELHGWGSNVTPMPRGNPR